MSDQTDQPTPDVGQPTEAPATPGTQPADDPPDQGDAPDTPDTGTTPDEQTRTD